MKKFILVLIVAGMTCLTSFAETYITNGFTGSSTNGWEFITGLGDGPILTGNGVIDDEGEGWLRLTQNIINQSSFVYCTNVIDSTYGLVFEFDFVVWGPQSLADGFTLAIFEADVIPEAGGYGGSLGYAQRNNTEGLNGGIVGFGFDTFGNFSSPSEGRIGGPGLAPNVIAVRGTMGEDRDDGYAFSTNTVTLDAFSTKNVSSRENAVIHSVRLTIPPNKEISIEWKTEDDTEYTTLLEYECTLTCPDKIRFGFTGGTGGYMANQEIRNFAVSSESPTPSDNKRTTIKVCSCSHSSQN